MAEQEELRITVSVDDQASAQLQGLRGQLSAMGSGPQAAGLERFRRQSTEVGKGVGGLSAEMRSLATRAGVVGGVVSAVTGKLIAMGSEFVGRLTDIKGYSDAIIALNKSAQLMGSNPAQLQAVTEWFQRSGQSAEEARSSFAGVQSVIGELQKPGSVRRRELFSGRMTREERTALQGRVQEIMQVAPQQRLTLIKQSYDQIVKNVTAMRGLEAGLEAGRKWLEFWRAPGLANVEGEVRKVSAAEEALIAARLPAAKAYKEETDATAIAYERIVKSATSILISSDLMSTSSGFISKNMAAAASHVETLETNIRKAKAAADAAAPEPEGFLDKFISPEARKRQEAIGEAVPGWGPLPQDKSAFDIAWEWYKTNVLEPKAPPPREAPEGFQPLSVTPAPATPRNLFQPQTDLEATPPPPPAPTLPPPGILDTPPPPSPEIALPPGQSGAGIVWDWLRNTLGGGVQAQPMQFPTAGAVGPTTERLVPAPEFLAGREAEVGPAGGAVENRRVIELQTTATQAATEEMQRLREAFEIFRPPAAATQQLGATLPEVVVKPEAQVASEPAPPPAPIIVPRETVAPFAERFWPQPPAQMPFGERFGDWPAPEAPPPAFAPPAPRAGAPSAFEGGTIGLMGGPAMDQNQIGQAMDARALDRAAAQRIDVAGNASIDVNVNAPAGTRVGAKAQGLFKKVSLARQTQMLPAEYGPEAATGIGAGEG